ncbi:hypothetical protein HNV12_15935 [Methanococcoides sp. SA1]|nr:hypothetical protein [Methanococcoides sp. SA1]
MKLRKNKNEECYGIFIGLLCWLIYLFTLMDLIIFSPILYTHQTGFSQIGQWILWGPMFIFMYVGTYIISKKVIDNERKIEYIVAVKSSIIGFIVWMTVMSTAYLFNIEISQTPNLSGGWITIGLIYYYIKIRKVQRT